MQGVIGAAASPDRKCWKNFRKAASGVNAENERVLTDYLDSVRPWDAIDTVLQAGLSPTVICLKLQPA